ncbi:hypothetical protein RhiirA5_425922 [Rhizophagus irregularis]|uniref:Uncharacterized protein n=1 Tax=Rhizophagus irregularis TaxID=588596 RepID=A0A2N0P567_9GLOM|nr:hypothetical protein RhiirA5_425922 [Rhizophagus irregularis]
MKSDICKLIKLIQSVNLFKGKEGNEGNEDKSNHFIIYCYGFNVLSFVLDILFAKIEAGSVKIIFFASVFFVIAPYVIKLGYAVYIILSELQLLDEPREKYHKIVLVMLISLALDIFNFQFCGYKLNVNVKLSKEFEQRIIIGEFIGMIIKDIPDLAFRIYFLSKAIDFSYLSIITPLASVLKILSPFTNLPKLMKTRNDGS